MRGTVSQLGLIVNPLLHLTVPMLSLTFVSSRSEPLNGLHHNDFVILGQFCAQIIT